MSFHYGIESIPIYSDKTDKMQNENRFFKSELKKLTTDFCSPYSDFFKKIFEANSIIIFTWLQTASEMIPHIWYGQISLQDRWT